jgi:hypothetical protein
MIQLPMKSIKKFCGRMFLPFAGLGSLIWFLVRVIPKPSRANYPCMRVAAPLASSFVIYLMGLSGTLFAFRKSRKYFLRSKAGIAAGTVLFGLIFALWSILKMPALVAHAWSPTDAPNTPIGTAKGINPGRVTWAYDASATTWDGSTGNWWDYIDQAKVDTMVSNSLRWLTSTASDPAAWDALFKYYNNNHGRGDVGYTAGEKIAIKVNFNNTNQGSSPGYAGTDNDVDASKQAVIAIVGQLVNNAGVAQSAITVYDAYRYVPNWFYNAVHAVFPNINFVDRYGGATGRTIASFTTNAITYSGNGGCSRNICTVATQATYMINLAYLKGHVYAGISLTAKNHYGSINGPGHTVVNSYTLPMGTYSPFVDLTGSRYLGGETVLYMIDGLYGARNGDLGPSSWTIPPFNGTAHGWTSSVFMSQDPVAIDSVGLDFRLSSWPGDSYMPNCDNYLHEEALANAPPSGVSYKPDGVQLASLGVHEHWNNSTDKKYTRNLGTGSGIELYTGGSTDTTPPTNIATVNDGTGADIASTLSTTQLQANWTASSDPEGFSGYKYAIGTSAGASNTVGWTTIGNALNVTKSGLTLTLGTTYYFSVKGVNNAALESAATNSNGQFVRGDTTPPGAPPAVRDGSGSDIASTLLTTQLSANWDAASDPESGIAKYFYAIGTTAGGSNLVGWTDNSTGLSVVRTGLTLTVGTTYYFSVKAQNTGGLQGPARNSDGQVVLQAQDTTPPLNITTLNDGTGAGDADTTSSLTQLSANWSSSSDPQSGISGYRYAIGTTIGGTDLRGWTLLGNVLSVTKTGLSLTAGTTYYFSVKAVNGVGLESSAKNSDGICVIVPAAGDTTPPVITNILTNNIHTTSVVIAWTTDEPSTGKVLYGLNTSYSSSTVEDTNLVTSHSVSLTSLLPETRYHYKAESKDSAGNTGDSQDCSFITPPVIVFGDPVKIYPNPIIMTPGAKMNFSLSDAGGGIIEIYTISGKLVQSLPVTAGNYDAQWDLLNGAGSTIKSGIYVYVIKDNAGNKKTGKMVITN